MRLHRIPLVLLAMLLASDSVLLAQEQASVVPVESESHRRGRSDGEEAAKQVRLQIAGWATGSAASNLIIPIGGSVIVFLIAANKNVNLPADRAASIAGEDSVYRAAYAGGYGRKLRSRRKTAAVAGPISAAVGLGVYLLILGTAY